eukprot:TRINITY_DN5895_c0_g1_i3.p1 TRINITY_DN5895_c0_g1~~TRINITY_DN5895_c0_g1_i3.p1  ORF type:complete len:229 (+),score=33.18 TRINITY_DN5895_c0_g1_i3:54-740(+)
MLRRIVSQASCSSPKRSLWTWGMVHHEFRDKAPHKTRWFKENFAVIDAPSSIKSEHGKVLFSEIQHDLDQLMHTDWTSFFNSYWRDVAASHARAYGLMYQNLAVGGLIGGFAKGVGLLPDLSGNTEEKELINEQLQELQRAVEWAYKTEAVYTRVYDERFILERHVWEPFEREKIFAGLIQMHLDHLEALPKDYQKKVKREMEYHIFALRRMVHDIPNVKRVFPVLMA